MRYFLEVSYKGTNYAGSQRQKNGITIQSEVEKALLTCFRKSCKLTGASRTDAGVHAYQNYFHIDVDFELPSHFLYNLNCILPVDIVIKSILPVSNDSHCRFHATSREYKYCIYTSKNPFLNDTAWFYPFKLNLEDLNKTASLIITYTDFTSFSKKNTHAKTNTCVITKSMWFTEGESLIYSVKANRFLRGMVRGLVGTMLMVGRGSISLLDFQNIFNAKDSTKASFSTPAKGLFLTAVEYPNSIIST